MYRFGFAAGYPRTSRRASRGRQGDPGRSPSECRPRASASLGERTRAISEAPSHSSQRITTSAPPSGRASSSPPSLGKGPEEPQSGQVRPFSRAIRVRRRFSRSVSQALLATPPVYPTPTHRRLLLPLCARVRGRIILGSPFGPGPMLSGLLMYRAGALQGGVHKSRVMPSGSVVASAGVGRLDRGGANFALRGFYEVRIHPLLGSSPRKL